MKWWLLSGFFVVSSLVAACADPSTEETDPTEETEDELKKLPPGYSYAKENQQPIQEMFARACPAGTESFGVFRRRGTVSVTKNDPRACIVWAYGPLDANNKLVTPPADMPITAITSQGSAKACRAALRKNPALSGVQPKDVVVINESSAVGPGRGTNPQLSWQDAVTQGHCGYEYNFRCCAPSDPDNAVDGGDAGGP